MSDIDLDAWPKCAVPACQNKCCLRLRSRYCWPHTPGDALTAQQNLLETEVRKPARDERKIATREHGA